MYSQSCQVKSKSNCKSKVVKCIFWKWFQVQARMHPAYHLCSKTVLYLLFCNIWFHHGGTIYIGMSIFSEILKFYLDRLRVTYNLLYPPGGFFQCYWAQVERVCLVVLVLHGNVLTYSFQNFLPSNDYFLKTFPSRQLAFPPGNSKISCISIYSFASNNRLQSTPW